MAIDNATPNIDEIVKFMTLTNNGPDAATNVSVTDQLPDGVTFVAATPSQGSYDSSTGVWAVGSVNAGSGFAGAGGRVQSAGSRVNLRVTASDSSIPTARRATGSRRAKMIRPRFRSRPSRSICLW